LKDKLVSVLKVAISLGLVAFIFLQEDIRNADWSAILADFQAWPWLLALAIYFVAIGFNVLKWQYLLRTLEIAVPFPSLYRHNLVGLFFANLPLSMVGADIARGWDLARHTEGRGAQVAISVLVDRLVGLAGFLVASVLGLAAAVALLGRADLTWLLVTMALLLAGFALAFSVLMSQRLRRLVEKLFGLGPLDRFLPLYQKLSNSVQIYRTHGMALVVALGIQLLTVVATCVVNYLAAVSAAADVPWGGTRAHSSSCTPSSRDCCPRLRHWPCRWPCSSSSSYPACQGASCGGEGAQAHPLWIGASRRHSKRGGGSPASFDPHLFLSTPEEQRSDGHDNGNSCADADDP
jgi:hypothetical protein